MARLKHAVSGVIVSVADEKVGRLGAEWQPVDGSSRSSASRSETPDKSWKVADIRAFADERGIDLGDATKKDDLLAAIEASTSDEQEPDEQSGDNE